MKIVAEHLTAMYHYAIIYDRKAVDNMKKDDDGFYSEENMRAIERSLKQLKDGKVVIKTMEELEQMAAEPEPSPRQSATEEPNK